MSRKKQNLASSNRNPIFSRRNGASPIWSVIIRWKRRQTRSKFVSWRRFKNLNASKTTSFGRSSKAPYFPHFFSPNSNLKTKACEKEKVSKSNNYRIKGQIAVSALHQLLGVTRIFSIVYSQTLTLKKFSVKVRFQALNFNSGGNLSTFPKK